jgi:hypothetical protein
MSETKAPAVYDVCAVLSERDRPDLVETLDGAHLSWWSEPDGSLRMLGKDYPDRYPEWYAELVMAPWHLDGLSDEDGQLIGAAIDEALGGIDRWTIMPGDWPDESASPAEDVPANLPPRPAHWQGMALRSQTELRIAEALDRASAMFCANPRTRVGLTAPARETREPDFLVVSRGKTGVLEVDGPSHTGRAAADHDRDRLFRQHGIRVVEHFDWERCYAVPDAVVAEFLGLLELNG